VKSEFPFDRERERTGLNCGLNCSRVKAKDPISEKISRDDRLKMKTKEQIKREGDQQEHTCITMN
jgi:hypothetical protein